MEGAGARVTCCAYETKLWQSVGLTASFAAHAAIDILYTVRTVMLWNWNRMVLVYNVDRMDDGLRCCMVEVFEDGLLRTNNWRQLIASCWAYHAAIAAVWTHVAAVWAHVVASAVRTDLTMSAPPRRIRRHITTVTSH